jgi:hypothetical protein
MPNDAMVKRIHVAVLIHAERSFRRQQMNRIVNMPPPMYTIRQASQPTIGLCLPG